MCTVTVIRESTARPVVRVVCNRDEHRERAPATPPRSRRLASGVRAWWPTDTAGGGTWIAAGDQGLVLAILNLNPHPPVPVVDVPGLESRGRIIPRLAGMPGAAAAMEAVRSMDLAAYAPFRLLAVDAGGGRGEIVEARWDRTSLAVTQHGGLPLCVTSSGLGDARVEARLDLFEEMVVSRGATRLLQDQFHRHRWPDRPEISVLMSRGEARTVSTTTIEVEAGAGACLVRMDYRDVPNLPAGATRTGRAAGVERRCAERP